MGYRQVRQALLAQGCASRPGKGDHEIWYCPCGRHQTVVTRPGNVSPGLIRTTVSRLARLPEGWLQ